MPPPMRSRVDALQRPEAMPNAQPRKTGFDPSRNGGIPLPGLCNSAPQKPLPPAKQKPVPKVVVAERDAKSRELAGGEVPLHATETKGASVSEQSKPTIAEAANKLPVIKPGFGGNSSEMHAFFLCTRYPRTYYKFEDPDTKKGSVLCFSNQAKEIRFVKFLDAQHIALSENSRVTLEDFASAMGLQPTGPASGI